MIQSKSYCCCSVTKSGPTLWDPMDCRMPGSPVLHSFREFAQTHVRWVRDAIQQSPPLSPTSPVLSLSQHQRLFQWVGCLHQVAKVLELQLQHSPSSEYSGLISFRIDWVQCLVFQRTLQHHNLKASILWHSGFLYGPTLTMVHDYWKNNSFDLYRSL